MAPQAVVEKPSGFRLLPEWFRYGARMLNPTFFYTVIMGYLLGSIPFGLLLTKLAGLGDIRSIGSGNIGATNVLRTGKKGLAALTLILDGGKGAVAVLLAMHFTPPAPVVAGLAAMLGHLFPVWLRFKGGKGVATAAGVITAMNWQLGLLTMGVWVLVAALFRYSSLAALVAAGLLPIEAYFFHQPDLVYFSVIIAILVYSKHSANIRRLLNGTETKIGGGKNDAAAT
jgi:glycerol-3-phosphate acyltransferase PlsY